MFYKLCRTVWASTKAFTVGGSCWYGALDGVGFLQPLGSCSFWNPLLVPFLHPLFLLAVVPVPVLAGACGPWLPVLVVASSQKGGLLGFFCPIATGECSLRSFCPVAAAPVLAGVCGARWWPVIAYWF